MTAVSPLEFAKRLDTLITDWIEPSDAREALAVEIYADGSVCFCLTNQRKRWPKYQTEIRERIKKEFH